MLDFQHGLMLFTGLTLKLLKLQKHLESWKTPTWKNPWSAMKDVKWVNNPLFDLLGLKRSCPPLPLLHTTSCVCPCSRCCLRYFSVVGSLPFTGFIHEASSSSLSSPLSKTAWDTVTTYCPPSCSVTNSRSSFSPLITFVCTCFTSVFYKIPQFSV